MALAQNICMQTILPEAQQKHHHAEEAVQSLRRIVKALHDYSTSVEQQIGLTGPQLWALWELGRAGSLSLKALRLGCTWIPAPSRAWSTASSVGTCWCGCPIPRTAAG